MLLFQNLKYLMGLVLSQKIVFKTLDFCNKFSVNYKLSSLKMNIEFILINLRNPTIAM